MKKPIPEVCVVCGAKPAGYAGYIIYEDGSERTGVPWCKDHLDHLDRYSNPIFSNINAFSLFQNLHPKLFARMKKKQVIIVEKPRLGI